MKFSRAILMAAISAAWAIGAAAAYADGYPDRPVHLIVPFAAGGAVDVLARTVGAELSTRWHQPVIVDNKPGAGGIVASQYVANAKPDGYTLMVVASGHATNPYLYEKLPYDTFKDFTPIALLGSSPNLLIVAADSPFKSVADVLAADRANPGSLSFGTAGIGTSTHLAGELLNYLAKSKLQAVAYKGGTQAINDLLGGHIPISFNNIPESLGLIRAGKLRALGVTTAKRSPALPDIPTIAEAGVAGFDTSVWWGLIGPGALPPNLTRQISADAAEAVSAPTVKATIAQLGAIVSAGSPEDFAALIKADAARWGPIIKAAGIKPE